MQERLESFCVVSGLRINYHKSSVYFSPNLLDQFTNQLSSRLGIRSSKNLGVYLCHQLVYHGNCSRVFDGLLNKVRQRLQGWKVKCLSRAGWITLAKTILNTMSIYHMQVQRLPATMPKALDKCVGQCV